MDPVVLGQGKLDAESLDVSIETLSHQFGVAASDTVAGAKSLREVFGQGASAGSVGAGSAPSAAPAGGASVPSFEKFLALLNERGFFAGLTPGTPAYQERLASAKSKFEQKYEGAGAGASAAGECAHVRSLRK